MNTPAQHLSQAPLPALVFGVGGGPLAWFLQLNAGYALASWPCFPGVHRMQAPMEGYGWSWPLMVAIMFAATLIALAALWVSWRNFQKTRGEVPTGPGHLAEAGAGRSCFLALWGVVFGGGFALASLVTGVAFIAVPRCGG